jgi:Tol biopolymer transport system component
MLIGGVVFLYVVVAVPLALQYSSFSWPGGLLLQELLGEAPNGKIAFLGVGAGYGDDIYVMNADGSGETRLTNSSAHEFSPVWSPDGEKIAFGRNSSIYVIDSDGTGQTRLTDDASAYTGLAWSPDGEKIAFTRSDVGTGNEAIYVMNADGSGKTRLTNFPKNEYSPTWSPDGEKIAFTREKVSLKLDAAIYDIYVMNADGTGRTRLTNTIESEEIPTWSPDGEKIAFWASGELGDPGAAICVINVEGTGRGCLAEDVIPGQLERDIEWGRD